MVGIIEFSEIKPIINAVRLYQIKMDTLAINKWEKNRFETIDFVGR